MGAAAAGVVIAGVATFWILGGKEPAGAPGGATAAQAVAMAPAATPVPAATPANLSGLMVATDPTGALVTVGDLPPKKSPAAFSDLPAGAQTVQVIQDGYDTFTTTTTATNGKINDLGTLILTRSKGPLTVTSTPAGCSYVLNSKSDAAFSVSGTTPMVETALPTGDYDVSVFRDGWPLQHKTVTVTKGEDQRAAFDFPEGTVRVETKPAGAKVEVGSQVLGVTPLVLTAVPPGDIVYTLQYPGYADATLNGTVLSGTTVDFQMELKKAAGKSHTASATHIHHHSPRPAPAGAQAGNGDSSGGEGFGEQLKRALIAQLVAGASSDPAPSDNDQGVIGGVGANSTIGATGAHNTKSQKRETSQNSREVRRTTYVKQLPPVARRSPTPPSK
jgi:hypothetical protein